MICGFIQTLFIFFQTRFPVTTNRTLRAVRTNYGKDFAKRAGLTQSNFSKGRTRLKSASRANQTGSYWAGLNEFSLGRYAKKQTKKGVRVRMPGYTGVIPHTFFVEKLRKNVFIQRKLLTGIPARVVESDKQFSGMRGAMRLGFLWAKSDEVSQWGSTATRFAEDKFFKDFQHELEWILSGQPNKNTE